MESATVRFDERPSGIIQLTLSRSNKRNALNHALLTSLQDQLQRVLARADVRVLILSAEPPVFCAGMDLIEASDAMVGPQLAGLIEKILIQLYDAPWVTIASIQGAAMAGGAGLVSACDFVLAAEGTKIGYPEVQRGVVASMVMALLRRQIPERQAKELLLLGDPIDAQQALAMGLVNRVVPGDRLVSETQALAVQLLRSSPQALAETKRLFRELWPSDFSQDVHRCHDHHLHVRTLPDFHEGLEAFAQKRSPRWNP
jgi:methylglutaconyl-CoA hydratase